MAKPVQFVFDDRGLRDAFRQYVKVSSSNARDALEKKAHMLVSGGKGVRGLYQEARKHAPETKAEIRALPSKLNYRIKRKAGMTVRKEIARRLRFAGWVQSTGWLNKRYGHKPAGGGAAKIRQVNNPRGLVEAKLSGFNMQIKITNRTPRAGEFAKRTGYVQRALNNITRDMMTYINAKMRQAAAQFSR